MINLFRNQKKPKGAATLVITIILLVTSTLIIIFAANQGRILTKISANYSRNTEAFQAAEAGLEFGINYLQQNSNTILASPVSGYIQPFSNSSVTNVSLANGSTYSITYTNPTASNYTLIKVTSTGTSADGSSTRVVSQLVKFGSLLSSPPTVPLVVKGDLTMKGSTIISNTQNNNTIQTGGSVSIQGSSSTILNSGTSSTSGNIQSDIQQNISSINSQSENDFFATYFGVTQTTVKNNSVYRYTNSSDTNYSSQLNGLTGTSVWIDQTSGTASIKGASSIGTATNPVLIVVDGDFDMSGSAVVYGFIFVLGTATTDLTGTVTVHGAVVTANNLTVAGNTRVDFDASTLSALQSQNTMSYYAKVPGSWKDY